MKSIKLFATALSLALLTAACSDNEYSVNNLTVGFAAAEMEYGMGSEYIYVPLVFDADNAACSTPFTAHVEVKAYNGEFAAVEDVDYMITSKDIVFASAESTPKVEIKLVNPADADELRFVLSVDRNDGAQGASYKETLVKCAKSEIDRVCGSYTVTGTNDGDAYTETWKITNNGTQLLIAGAFGEEGPLVCDYDAETHVITMGLGAANYLNAYNFSGIGPHYIAPVLYDGDSDSVYTGGEVEAYVNDSYDEILFDIDDLGFFIALFTMDTNKFAGYVYDGPYYIKDNTIRKIKKVQ